MPRPKINKGLVEPRKLCPFSGEPIRIVQVSSGDWQVRGRGWVGTELFQFRDQAEWWVSHNLGVPPEFSNPSTRVQVVGDRTEYADKDEVTPVVDRALKAGQELGAVVNK